MKISEVSVDDIAKLSGIAIGLFTLGTKLVALINESQSINQEDKDALKASIKNAQAQWPEWESGGEQSGCPISLPAVLYPPI